MNGERFAKAKAGGDVVRLAVQNVPQRMITRLDAITPSNTQQLERVLRNAFRDHPHTGQDGGYL